MCDRIWLKFSNSIITYLTSLSLSLTPITSVVLEQCHRTLKLQMGERIVSRTAGATTSLMAPAKDHKKRNAQGNLVKATPRNTQKNNPFAFLQMFGRWPIFLLTLSFQLLLFMLDPTGIIIILMPLKLLQVEQNTMINQIPAGRAIAWLCNSLFLSSICGPHS